ncbi:uncharacterized protein [Clytia hemisphaerica]|uniref:CUB domain-containing protein n=2 Tax=Clytia hemisphaerica TaxID=252671 RepID=A0A7M5XE91_9CNID
MDTNLISCTILLLIVVASPIYANDCPVVTKQGTYGSISGGRLTNCNKEVFKLKFGQQMAVKLTWNSFNVGGDMPYCTDGNMKIYLGCGEYSWNNDQIAEFCSGNMVPDTPHDIYAYTDCLTIELKHNVWSKKGSFSASYDKYRGTGMDTCSSTSKKEFSSSKGVIASPNWPRSTLSSCKWELDRSSRDGYLIHFMDIKKQRWCSSDKQQIEVEDEEDFKYGKEICSPKTEIRYFKPDVDFKYKKGTDWNGRGFVVGWVAFRDPYDVTYGFTMAGYIAAAIIIPLCFICCIACYVIRKRRGYVFGRGPNYVPPTGQTVPPPPPGTVTYQSTGGTATVHPPNPTGAPAAYPTQHYGQPAYPPPAQGVYPAQTYAPPPQGYPPTAPQGAYPPPQQPAYPPPQGYAPPPQQAGYATAPPTYNEAQSPLLEQKPPQ